MKHCFRFDRIAFILVIISLELGLLNNTFHKKYTKILKEYDKNLSIILWNILLHLYCLEGKLII